MCSCFLFERARRQRTGAAFSSGGACLWRRRGGDNYNLLSRVLGTVAKHSVHHRRDATPNPNILPPQPEYLLIHKQTPRQPQTKAPSPTRSPYCTHLLRLFSEQELETGVVQDLARRGWRDMAVLLAAPPCRRRLTTNALVVRSFAQRLERFLKVMQGHVVPPQFVMQAALHAYGSDVNFSKKKIKIISGVSKLEQETEEKVGGGGGGKGRGHVVWYLTPSLMMQHPHIDSTSSKHDRRCAQQHTRQVTNRLADSIFACCESVHMYDTPNPPNPAVRSVLGMDWIGLDWCAAANMQRVLVIYCTPLLLSSHP